VSILGGRAKVPEYLLIEDAWFNQLSANVGEAQGAVFFKPGVVIGGLPVELRTALMYESTGMIAPGTVGAAPRTFGWSPASRTLVPFTVP
jgi:hypothetical protein